MRICFIANAGNIHTRKWVNYFAQKGHEVHVISNMLGEGFAKSVRLHLLTTRLVKSSSISEYVNALGWIIQIRRLIRRIKPDILDAHYITIYGYLAVTAGFHPLVLTPWGSDILVEAKQQRLYRFLTKYALKKAEMVICDSEMMKQELLNLGVNPVKIKIIYNGINTQKFSPRRGQGLKVRLGIPEVPVVIATRSLEPIYNTEMLIRVVPLVLKQEPETRFMIVGDGEQREFLENLAMSLGVSANILFTGWIPNDELPDYLASSDIYVSTSLSDSTSLCLQEAMACQVAPVVTDLPGNREWIRDGENGFLVSLGDIEALAERIVYLIRNKEIGQKVSKANRKIIMERAEYEKEMSKAEKIYQEQVEGNKR